ncbi:unnamed protein product [Ilex paraguariensis]|uniref:Transposase n=1 Tax=Ilex paraguariensis TaxID=185542 RepID=A0ABC8TQD4_9AQUA
MFVTKRLVDVFSDFLTSYGLDVSYHQTWIGVEKVKGMLFGDHTLSYKQLHWYMDAANNTNPGSHIVLYCDDETNRFHRLFVLQGCIEGFNYCRPILFIDGTFIKGKYK